MKNEDYILIGKIIENVQNIEYDLTKASVIQPDS